MEKIKTIYDFGFQHEGTREENLKGLLVAYSMDVDEAALYLGFQYFTKEPVDFKRAIEWLKVAASQKNISAIAAHRWLAKMYKDGSGTEKNYKTSFWHNEVFFTLYSRFWPAPDHVRLSPCNPKVKIYNGLKLYLQSHIPHDQQKNLALEASRFCDRFKITKKEHYIRVPGFLKNVSKPSSI